MKDFYMEVRIKCWNNKWFIEINKSSGNRQIEAKNLDEAFREAAKCFPREALRHGIDTSRLTDR